jgi:16S rRNA (guanine527-N7)-methyltransferase
MGVEDAEPRLKELAGRYGLGAAAQGRLAALLAALERNPRAPTAVREPVRAVDVHVADSLVALEVAAVRSAAAIADVGSGAGFPGAAVAAALGRGEVRLVESQSRRCAFLAAMLAEAGVGNARVVCERVEAWREGAGAHDAVLARAVAGQPVVLEYAAPLLREGGTLVDWRGRRDAREEGAALRAAAELGLRRIDVLPVAPFRAVHGRHLHLYLKVRHTPRGFPRRAGLARKRPLGGL